MIARLKIAPDEKWCPQAKALLERSEATVQGCESSTGEIVGIDTASMRPSRFCEGREWLIIESSEDLCSTDIHTFHTRDAMPNTWICEHMLEMD